MLDHSTRDATTTTVRDARREYFLKNGFGSDGGYSAKWIPLKFGWFTFYVFNSKSRKRAVPLHDLHHIATGFETDARGEALVAIWELSSGTHDKWFAFFINVPALIYGFLLWPRDSYRAWQLGRESNNLYQQEFSEELLDMTVAALQEMTVGQQLRS